MSSPAPSLSDRGSSESETITGTCSSPATSLDELVDHVTVKYEFKSDGAEPTSFTYTEAPGLPQVPDPSVPPVVDETDINTPDRWVKRDPRLVRLTGKHPLNCEARLDTLFAAGFLTPTSLFYVRNHGAVPKVNADRARNWEIRVHGLVQREVTFSIADLKRLFPVVTLPVTLVCAGNRRKEQNVVQKSLGFSWGAAGLSTALFTGVYLADVLEYVKPKRPNSKHVVFEGADTDLPNGPYGTSQKLSVAASREKGMLIAWKMNGLDLEPDHGFPLRMVIPGQIGGRSVKWLTRIEISEVESQHYLHFNDNKMLPTQLGAQKAREEQHWWRDPKYIINDLNVNSAIAEPNHDEVLPVHPEDLLESQYQIKGYAYAGGGRRVTRTEVSLDEGNSWDLADIVYPEDLYRSVVVEDPVYGSLDLTERDTSFCWCFWTFNVSVKELTKCTVIMVRATDESQALQQRDMYWNATGMMNNWWFRVAVHHERNVDGVDILRFEHPTLAGVASGGWMERMKNSGLDVRKPDFGGRQAPPSGLDNPGPPTEAAVNKMINPDVTGKVSLSEYLSATSGSDRHEKKAWFIVNGEVYDGSGYLDEHPGGADSIWLAAGEKDSSEDFLAIHSDDAKVKLVKFHIGKLMAESDPEVTLANETTESSTFLQRSRWNSATLRSVVQVNHDSAIYRFSFPSPNLSLGLPVGQHVFVRLRQKGGGAWVQRAYTPVSPQGESGQIDILIKKYLPTAEHPIGGKMSVCFHALVVGDLVEFKGPLGSFVWEGRGNIRWKDIPRTGVRNIGLICGGSGITPILQVLRSVLGDESDEETQLWLLDANKTEADILCREELDSMVEIHGSTSKPRLSVHHTLGTPSAGWSFSTGRINDDMLRRYLPPPSEDAMILVCGPDGMVQKTVRPGLERIGWDIHRSVVAF